jgi:hypothetical protein
MVQFSPLFINEFGKTIATEKYFTSFKNLRTLLNKQVINNRN